MTGAKFFFVRGCSFVLSYLGILFLLANRQLNITKWPQNLFVYPEIFICAQITPSTWRIYLRADKKLFIWAQINLFLCRRGTLLCQRGTLLVGGSVTANIGWYVVPILHDQPSCNIDITWPVKSTLWVVRWFPFRIVVFHFRDITWLAFHVISILHDRVPCNFDSTYVISILHDPCNIDITWCLYHIISMLYM